MTSTIGLQVRTDSKRLPCKAFLNLQGRTIIGYLLESLYQTFQNDDIFVLTSREDSDDALVKEVEQNYNANVRRGSLADVRSRYVELCKEVGCEYVVRLTGDNPFVRPMAVREAIVFALVNDLDYVSNKVGRFFPKGLDIEVIRATTLLTHATKYDSPELREHVTPSIIGAVLDGNLRGGSIEYPDPLKSSIPLSIDTPQDYLSVIEYLHETGNESVFRALGLDDSRFQFSIVDLPNPRIM